MKSAPGARSGSGSWLAQRATALLLAAAVPGLTIYVLSAAPLDFAAWQALLASTGLRVLLLLTAAALALHAWIGMRDIFMDYVHPTGPRLALELLTIVTLAGSVTWLAAVLWRTP